MLPGCETPTINQLTGGCLVLFSVVQCIRTCLQVYSYSVKTGAATSVKVGRPLAKCQRYNICAYFLIEEKPRVARVVPAGLATLVRGCSNSTQRYFLGQIRPHTPTILRYARPYMPCNALTITPITDGMAEWVEHPSPILGDPGIRTSWVRS